MLNKGCCCKQDFAEMLNIEQHRGLIETRCGREVEEKINISWVLRRGKIGN